MGSSLRVGGPSIATPTGTRQAGSLDAKGLVLVLLLFLIFASTFIAAKYGLRGIPPFTLGAIRTGLAAVILFGVCFALRTPFPRSPRAWLAAGILGVFNTAAPATVSFWGLQHTEASLANVLMATQPFLVAILAHYFLPNDRLFTRKVIGLVVGFMGVCLISLDKLGPDPRLSLIGQAAVFSNAMAQAVSTVLGKNLTRQWQTLPLSAAQTLGGFVVVACVALIFDSGTAATFTVENVSAAVYLAVFPTVIGYTLWFYLLGRYDASKLSSFSFSQPVFGIALGWLFLSEGFSWLTPVGAVLVSWGVFVVNSRKREDPASGG